MQTLLNSEGHAADFYSVVTIERILSKLPRLHDSGLG